jgi:hypothetical protein
MTRVLLTTPIGPYDTHYYDRSLTDAVDQRFTRGCGIWTASGHMHINFAHLIAQNIEAPTVFLEYPTRENFEAELRAGYDYLGINGFHNQRDIVVEMCKTARRIAPKSTIILGGWAGIGVREVFPEAEWKKFADDICVGEGIRYMRQLLGEDVAAPIHASHLPKCAASLPWIEAHPQGDMGTIIASVGCPNGCDFCGTTHMYARKRLRFLSAEQTFQEVKRYYRDNPQLQLVNILEEDTFADKRFVEEFQALMENDTEFGLERMGYLCLASNQSLSRWDFDDVLKTGVTTIFIGVESKFAPQEGYKKRTGRSIEETFSELHRRGISTIGAWICGFDFQTRENVEEDLQSFISLEPTYQQLTRLCPFPGTPLWDKVAEEGRIDPSKVTTESISFFGGGGMKPKGFYDHELMGIIDGGYERLYETWGACTFRQWKVVMNGYEYCVDHADPLVRKRAAYHRMVARELYPLTLAMEHYAPNGTVRKRVRDQRSRYRCLFGEPDSGQRMLENVVLRGARKATKKLLEDPGFVRPKEEPYKRYDYHRRAAQGECPYTLTHPNRELAYQIHDWRRRVRGSVMQSMVKVLASANAVQGGAGDQPVSAHRSVVG